jgi:Xaa-Pro aminopeptidase
MEALGTGRLKKGDLFTMDFGCVFEGYCSDFTRTVAVGKRRRRNKTVYNIVKDAQKRALEQGKRG